MVAWPAGAEGRPRGRREDRMSDRTSLYFDLLDAFAESDCPACRLSLRAVQRYLASLSYEYVNDPGERAQLRAARGFCNHHAWQWWDEQYDRLGAAIVYLDVLTTIGRQLEKVQPVDAGRLRGPVAGALRLGGASEAGAAAGLLPEGPCPACREQAAAEGRLLDTLLAHLDAPDFRAAYAASAGLCLPHLAQAVTRGRGPAVTALVALARERLAGLRAELEEYLRKQRHEHRHEPRGAEQTAPRRAVLATAGAPGVWWPPRPAGPRG
jgi:hypothetical protein